VAFFLVAFFATVAFFFATFFFAAFFAFFTKTCLLQLSLTFISSTPLAREHGLRNLGGTTLFLPPSDLFRTRRLNTDNLIFFIVSILAQNFKQH
jgi:hypothetical protein